MKALRYIGLVLVIFLWAEAYFPEFYLAMGKSHLFPDDYRYGDLYRLSFLPQFKESKYLPRFTSGEINGP
ncbi:hypothetical protein ACFFJX_04535 [Pseudarcicella hirudinis]|uniref:hypothetical protein n=1 Tax=Pseudarcicella hirudinis TaxID=1079859 RepID=UPI0035E9E0CF